MMENDELLEKRNRKKKKYKSMKICLWVLAALCTILLAVCAFAGFSLFKMNNTIEDMTQQVSDTNEELNTVQATANNLSIQIEALVAEKNNLSEEKNSLTAENERLNQELLTLQENLSGSSTSIEDLEKQIDEKNKNISSLESKIKTLNSNISKLESQIQDLKAQLKNNESSENSDDNSKPEEPKEDIQTPTTTEKVAYLTFDDGISAYTNSILYSSGGYYCQESRGFVGTQTENFVSSLHADVCVMGTSGISLEGGITTAYPIHKTLEQKILASSDIRLLGADHSKFDKIAMEKVAELSDVSVIVTDSGIYEDTLKKYREKVEIITV